MNESLKIVEKDPNKVLIKDPKKMFIANFYLFS